jgi:zinc protease
MILKSPRAFAPLLAAVLVTCTAYLKADWPQQKSDLKPEGKAVFGTLENGLRYVIFPNKVPMPGRASMRLYMDAGSLMEENDQQGMAHFLEHMAFNGSKHFPPGTMVERFQRLGMGFGADTNAHTSFKETVYKLELPRVDEAMLSEALQLFRDDLDGMLLEEKEIDRERGVILSEKLARDSVEERIELDEFHFSMPDALLSSRFPIGLEDTIKNMKRERFVEFYNKWYTPKRATVVVTGDVDVALAEGLIKKMFGDAKAAKGDSPDADMGKITKGRGVIARLKTEMESPAVEISIEVLSDATKDPDTSSLRRTRMVRGLADAMLNQRFSEQAKKENSPFMEGESYNSEMFKFVRSDGVGVKCKPEKWKDALSTAEQELRRALEHGFTKAEFEEGKATLLKAVHVRAEQKDTRKNAMLADTLVQALAAEHVYTDPTDDEARVEKDMSAITADDCVASLRKAWETKDINIYVGGNLKLDNGSDTILAAYHDSQKVPVAAPKQDEGAVFAYTNFGPEGKIAKKEDVKDLEVTQAVFENGVRVNVKKTDFEKNGIRILVSFGGGKLEAPADKPGLIPFAQSVFDLGGLEKHSVDELRRIMASKTVGSQFVVGDDSFVLAGRTTPKDLEIELQLMCAYLTAPGYREEAQREFDKTLDSLYTQLQHTAEGMMQNEVVGFVHSEDERFRFPKQEVLAKRNLAELKTWLTPALKDSYMEIAVVGDVDADTALKALASTFGALPKRADKKPAYTKEREVKFPTQVHDKDFSFTSEIPRAYAFAYWPTTDQMSDIQRARRLSLLGQIMDDRLRLKIRQELGETYSPASYHVPSDTFTGYGFMTAMSTLKPEQVEKVKPMYVEIGNALSKGGITDDEFQRAKEPILQQLIQMRRDNNYWLKNVLRNCQEQPQRLDWSRSIIEDFKSTTKEDMMKLAKEYLPAARALTIGLIPEKTEAGSAAPAAAK